MNWELAIEKNREALKRVLAMLLAMIEIASPSGEARSARTGNTSADTASGAPDRAANTRPSTLPRHLHRFVLRLLRPAEAATRRLIVIAARGLVVKIRPFRPRSPSKPRPRLNRKNGYGTGILIRPGPLPQWARDLAPKRSASFPLFDPMKRFFVKRRPPKPAVMPRIISFDSPLVPLFQSPPVPVKPQPSADDPLDAGGLHRRLNALGRALEDLDGQAKRMARWQARRDAWLEEQRANDAEPSPLHDRAPYINNVIPTKRRRFNRLSPLRPGRPPGWRRKPDNDVYEVLSELQGLAVWAAERRDSS